MTQTDTASSAIFATLSGEGTEAFVRFLLELQTQGDEQAADDLFIGRIAWIASESLPGSPFDPQEYAGLGEYLFDGNPIRAASEDGKASAQLVYRRGRSANTLRAGARAPAAGPGIGARSGTAVQGGIEAIKCRARSRSGTR